MRESTSFLFFLPIVIFFVGVFVDVSVGGLFGMAAAVVCWPAALIFAALSRAFAPKPPASTRAPAESATKDAEAQ